MRSWVCWIVVIAGIFGAAIWRCAPVSRSPCEIEARHGDQRRAIELCVASYQRTASQRDLAWAAQAYMYTGQQDRADELAGRLLAGPFTSDALRILSYSNLRNGLANIARVHAALAFGVDLLSGDRAGLARDAIMFSHAAWKAGDFSAALAAADQALEFIRDAPDAHAEVTAELARADALRRMGDAGAAAATLGRAVERAATPCDQAWARLKNALCLGELGREGLAMIELAAADHANQRCGSADITVAVAMNESWLLRWRDPGAAVTRLDRVAAALGDDVELLLLRAYLAADRGDLVAAHRGLVRAAALEAPDADWPWEIERARAELAELRGGWFADWLAEYHYRRATAMVEALRPGARARSAYLVSSHRGPYDGLIALLARHARWRDALAVILELDASDMLRATADEVVIRDRAAIAEPAPAPGGPAPRAVSVAAVLAAWRSRDLVIVIAPSRRQIGPGRERVYRLRIGQGRVTGEDVGDAAAARASATALFGDPANRDAARALGRLFVPADAARDRLHVLAIGALGKVPLPALRDGAGALIVGRRPLVRVLALHATGPEATGSSPPIILADPRGDLGSAALEGAVVAAALGGSARAVGATVAVAALATRAQLWAARDAELLHVAGHIAGHADGHVEGHAGDRGRWRALRLADGDVEPGELVQHHLAPRLAVLAGCGSAAAMDEEGWGSIAAALLESGTAMVIATDRSVDDAAALAVMREFYAQPDWRRDPDRALARVQQTRDAAVPPGHAAGADHAWAAFSVFARPPEVR